MVVYLMCTRTSAIVLKQSASAKCNISVPISEFHECPDDDFIRTRHCTEVGDFHYKHLISSSARSVYLMKIHRTSGRMRPRNWDYGLIFIRRGLEKPGLINYASNLSHDTRYRGY